MGICLLCLGGKIWQIRALLIALLGGKETLAALFRRVE